DNLAVSGHHAKISVDEGHYVIEDLSSLNGTFLNSQRIHKSVLKDGDEILLGKHTLVYRDESGLGVPASLEKTQELQQAQGPSLNSTVVLDTKARREFLAQATAVATGGAAEESKGKIGCLIVLSGKTDQREYILTSKLSVIGKSDMASVKLKGWFAPKVAAVINRREGRYEIGPSDRAGAARVNSEVLSAARELREGDLIQIGRVRMQFNFRE
ncbi:MAG: FHA domain-containing protein, partial [Nitrospiraceae bacterium]